MKYSYYGKKIKTVEDWLNDKQREKQPNRNCLDLIREINDLKYLIGANSKMLYFLTKYLDSKDGNNFWTMFRSCIKQRDFLRRLQVDLKKFSVSDDYLPVFDIELKKIRNRCDYVKLIVKENLKLTKYWPYFNAMGFEKLENLPFNEDELIHKNFINEINAWNAEHQDEIAKHLDSVKELIANRDRHRNKNKAREKAEKEAVRAEKRQRKAEDKEREQNLKRAAAEEKKINNSFKRYWS